MIVIGLWLTGKASCQRRRLPHGLFLADHFGGCAAEKSVIPSLGMAKLSNAVCRRQVGPKFIFHYHMASTEPNSPVSPHTNYMARYLYFYVTDDGEPAEFGIAGEKSLGLVTCHDLSKVSLWIATRGVSVMNVHK